MTPIVTNVNKSAKLINTRNAMKLSHSPTPTKKIKPTSWNQNVTFVAYSHLNQVSLSSVIMFSFLCYTQGSRILSVMTPPTTVETTPATVIIAPITELATYGLIPQQFMTNSIIQKAKPPAVKVYAAFPITNKTNSLLLSIVLSYFHRLSVSFS